MVRRYQTAALSAQAAALALFAIAEVVLLVVVFWPHAPAPPLLGWAAALIICMLPNFLLPGWRRRHRLEARTNTMTAAVVFAIALVFGNLLGWGGYLLYGYGGEIERLILFAVLFGSAIGAGAGLAPMPLAAVAFCISVLTPLALRLLDLAVWQTIALDLLLLVYAIAVYDIGQRLFANLKDNVRARHAVARQAEWIEALLKDFAEGSSEWLWETDPDLRVNFVTDGAERILGPDASDRLLGVPLTAMLSYVSLPELPSAADVLGRHEPFRNIRMGYRRDDGEVFWLLVSGKPRFAPDGTFLGYRGNTADITARVQSENALTASEQQLRLITDNLPGSITYVDSELICRFANRTAARWAGRPAEELFDQPLAQSMTEKSFNAQLPHYRQVLAGESQRVESLVSHTDGRTRHLDTTLVPHRNDAGEVVGFFSLSLDATEQRRAEQRARDAERMLRQALEASDTGYALFDADDRLVFFNGALARLAGAQAQQAMKPGVRFEELARQISARVKAEGLDQPDEDWLRWRMSIHRTNFVPFELHAKHSGRWLRFSEQAMEGGALLISVEDITETRQQQQQLAQAQKMEAVGQLTGGVAHDFNNMLTSLMGYLDLLRDGARLDAADADLVDAALRVSERGASLTRHLLAFSRKQVLAPTPVDVNALIDGMSDLLQRTLGESIVIETDLSDALWPVLVDDAQLSHALLNLAINARDAMPDGGRLRIATANIELEEPLINGSDQLPAGAYVRLTVSDNGSGIAPEHLDSVFEPFFTTKDVGEGSGLGLSMVYGFVRQSDGAVSIDSTPDAGTSVAMYLPRLETAASVTPPAADRPPAAVAGGGETVLLVEDDAEVRAYVAHALANLGYRVLPSSDGHDAIASMNGHDRIDLLLTDMVLPGGMDGLAVADAFRAARPDARVLFMSGYAESEARRRLSNEAAGGVLAKPFTLDKLGEAVRHALERPPTRPRERRSASD